MTEFPIATAGSNPTSIAAGPDAALWFTEQASDKIGRITTTGAVTEFPIPTAGSNPTSIAAGPDGALWFTEAGQNKIGRITTAGAVTEFPIPSSSSAPFGITAGPDGALWFTEENANEIGRITTAGAVTNEIPIPTAGSEALGITASPDGNLWFAEAAASQIGRVDLATSSPPQPPPPPPSPPGGVPAPPRSPSPAAGTPCLAGDDAKYPDFPPALGVARNYDLSDPSLQPDGVTEQTVSFGASSQQSVLYLTTGGCWGLQRNVSGPSLNGYPKHDEFTTYGDVNLNGVILVPVNGRGSAVVPAQLHAGLDGTIYATGGDTRYDVQIVAQDWSRLTVGRADLGAAPWSWNGRLGVAIGELGPAPGGPAPFGRPLVDGLVFVTGVGSASITAFVQLPPLFSSSPDGGPAPTAQLSYGLFTNPNTPAAPTAGGSGGSGGGLNAGHCDPQTHAHCSVNLESGDRSGRTRRNRASARAADPSGQPLHLTVPELYLGALRLTNAFLDYNPARDVWSGGGIAQLGGFGLLAAPPPPDNGLGLHGDGSFDHGGASLSVPGGVPLFPGVDLTELRVTFALDPTRLSGEATVSVAGGLVTIHGGVLLVFPNQSHPYSYQSLALPGVQKLQTDTLVNPITNTAIGLAGTVGLRLPVVGESDLANGYIFYIAPSYFEFAGQFHLGAFGVTLDGGVHGALDTASSRFSLLGSLSACAPDFGGLVPSACIGVNGVVSSAGFGGCGSAHLVHTFSVGLRYLYNGGLTIFLDGCDLTPVQVDVRAAHDARASVTSAAGFVLPAGLPSTSITVTGAGGAPRVRIDGPHGQVAASDPGGRAVDTRRFVIVPLPHMNETLIGIKRPGAGRWTIAPQPGAPPIIGVSHANGLPPARIAASVHGHGHGHGRARGLAYRIRPRAGQTVTFAERAGQVFHVIGTARGSSGTLTFNPAVAPAGRRQIVALISLSGVDSETLVAGHYTAPAPPRAGAPGRVRVSRRGTIVAATWGPAANAHGYAVTVTLSDGRRIALSRPAGRRAITLPTLMRGLGARVTVMAIGPDGNPGPSRAARLAPTPPPGQVHGITATHTSAGVVVRWRRARAAVRYLVAITVSGPKGARYVEMSSLTHLQPSTDLARLKPGTIVKIMVRAMTSDAKLGPAGTGRYKATRPVARRNRRRDT